jgi:hypothetical protein
LRTRSDDGKARDSKNDITPVFITRRRPGWRGFIEMHFGDSESIKQ